MTQVETRTEAGTARRSRLAEVAAAPPALAREHFLAKLSVETDPSDVFADIESGSQELVVVDTRASAAYAREHIAGALNLPHREISAASTAGLSREVVYVAYCTGPGCNASTKGAARLAELGFRVKEMIGGLEYWKREGLPVEAG